MNKHFSDAEVFQVVCDVRVGTAEPDSVRQLMRQFCDSVDSGERPSRYLMEYLRDAFRSYLTGDRKNIEVALGLRRGRSGPANVDNSYLAVEVLRARLAGESYLNAVYDVEERFGREGHKETTIKKAWNENKTLALLLLRQERPADSYPWSPAEVRRLKKIYRGTPFIYESAPDFLPGLGSVIEKKLPD